MAALADNETPIICNGFKDAEFIEMAMLAQKIGRHIIPVVEKYTELDLILEYAEKVGVRPTIGMRVKLAARGGGRWQSSGGYRSKFGLTVGEILRGLEELKTRGMEDCFQLLHFHLGSQIPNIRIVKGALNEAARVYVELVKAGAGLKYLDVGGGLGVDYDGSQTNFESSVNYTLQEYANDVVYHLQTRVRRGQGGAPDHRVGERPRHRRAPQRAGVQRARRLRLRRRGGHRSRPTPDMEQPLIDLIETYDGLTTRNALESYHDAQQALDMAMNLFSGGYLPLEQRSLAENLYWAICLKLQKLVKTMDEVPEDLQSLDESLSDTYFCNFSLFQSIPDSWAIKQLFPIMPIHRLNERPTRHAVLGDITCDSDGKIDQFIDRRDVKRHAAAAHLRRLAVLPGRLSGRRVSGDPRRPAQPARRHARRPRQPRRERRRRPRRGHQGRHGARGARLRGVRCRACCSPSCAPTSKRPSARAVSTTRKSGRLLRFYEDGLNGYTYLEERPTR